MLCSLNMLMILILQEKCSFHLPAATSGSLLVLVLVLVLVIRFWLLSQFACFSCFKWLWHFWWKWTCKQYRYRHRMSVAKNDRYSLLTRGSCDRSLTGTRYCNLRYQWWYDDTVLWLHMHALYVVNELNQWKSLWNRPVSVNNQPILIKFVFTQFAMSLWWESRDQNHNQNLKIQNDRRQPHWK